MLPLILATLVLAFLLRSQQPTMQARPGPAEVADPAPTPVSEAQLRALLPPGARLLQRIPLPDGSLALAWEAGGAARTGVAGPAAEPGGGYRLWTASTPNRADVAGEAGVDITHLPGLAEAVLISSYRTEECCAWVNLFALSETPRLLFASPTPRSRLVGIHVLVQKNVPGSYPDGPHADTDHYTWNGREFALSGATLAPQHYFPLSARMRWRYQSRNQVVERWVQEGRQAEAGVRYLVRSIVRRGGSIGGLSDTVYTYEPEGQVLLVAPAADVILGASPGEGSSWPAAGGLTASVIAVRPSLTVRAGTFRDVLVVALGDTRRYFAAHTGLIREDRGDETILELISFSNE